MGTPRNTDVGQVDLTFSPKQANHNQDTYLQGKSYLNMDQNTLLNDLNNGNYIPVGTNSRGMPIVQFNYDEIGTVVGRDGSVLGTTNQAIIHINNSGQIHIIPRLSTNIVR